LPTPSMEKITFSFAINQLDFGFWILDFGFISNSPDSRRLSLSERVFYREGKDIKWKEKAKGAKGLI